MTNLSPKISIVVPMFNAERFIKTCVESILTQTFQDFELILVNDCSTDKSIEIVQSFNDPRINILETLRNSGESFARNFGLSFATGKYIYFADDDDVLLSQTLEILYFISEKTQNEIVYMNSWYEAPENFVISDTVQVDKCVGNDPTPRELSTELLTRLQKEFMCRNVEVPPWMKLQRRDFLLKHGIYFPSVTRDGDGLFNFAELCYVQKALVIDYAGYIHRNYPQQTMGLSAEQQFRQTIASIPETMRFMEEILDSTNSLRSISTEDRANLLVRQLIHLFRFFLLPSYEGKLEFDKIEEILTDNILNSKLLDVRLIRTIFNALAKQLLLYEMQRKKGKF